MINELTSYCLQCLNKPCTKGCPLHNDIPEFIKLVNENKVREAYYKLVDTNIMPSITGRICPYNSQCTSMCTRKYKGSPVEIGTIESYIGDYALDNLSIPLTSSKNKYKKIAIIGGGPCGLTCAAYLKMAGYDVTIYERYNYLGGLLMYGIPSFRLDKDLVKRQVNKILDLGIKVKYNMELGKNLSLEDLDEYQAIFISIGANKSSMININNINLKGIYGANEMLEHKNFPDFKDKTVTIYGCGNVAMDTSRTIKKMGAKSVKVLYRRSEKEMPAEITEYEEAKKEGIEFLFQTFIVNIIGTEKIEKLELVKTELVKSDNDDRLTPVNIDGSNYFLDTDYLIMAIGSKPDSNLTESLNLELQDNKRILTHENGRTSNPKIFAGGDITSTKQAVAYVSYQGRVAANSIIEYLER